LVDNLSNTKRHPFLPESELVAFREQATKASQQLTTQRDALLKRLTQDETLDLLDAQFGDCTGKPLSPEVMKGIESEGAFRFQHGIPPGYRDGKKESAGDPARKYGDLILWKQVIAKAKESKKPLILVTDDQKTDWWLEQSGRTIGPRPELIEEFLQEAGERFWMYSVDRFLAELAKTANVGVSTAVIEEVKEVSEKAREEAELQETESAADEVAAPKRRSRRAAPNEDFMRPMDLSPALEEVIGAGPMPRTEIVSRLWAYIKKNKLQDTHNKRMVNSDAKLRALFRKDQVSMFEMAGLIGRHIQSPRR
jgi:hypothetical protein